MQTIRAKFKVDSIVGFQHGASIRMTPVYSNDPAQEVYIDITPAA
ncbi:hypothetical protein [Methylomonas sp. HYX-M1]